MSKKEQVNAKIQQARADIASLKVLPSNVELIGFEVEMMSAPDRETVLKKL